MVCSDQHFRPIFDQRRTATLQDSAPWQTYQDSIPEFWWLKVRGRVLRYRSISVQSRALLPATCTLWFISKIVDILVPNSWFGYRCRSSCLSSSLLLVLHIQHVILLSGLCRFERSLFIFSRNCLITTNVVRRLITSIGCRPWSRIWLCFRKWIDGHFIFCRWLSSIIVFAVPSCLPCWIQSSTGARSWFLWTLCAHLFSNDNSSCLGSYSYF